MFLLAGIEYLLFFSIWLSESTFSFRGTSQSMPVDIILIVSENKKAGEIHFYFPDIKGNLTDIDSKRIPTERYVFLN